MRHCQSASQQVLSGGASILGSCRGERFHVFLVHFNQPDNFISLLLSYPVQEAKKRAASAMLDKLALAGSDAAKSIVFSGSGGGSVAKNRVPDNAEDFDFVDLKVEPMTLKQSKSMQHFFNNLDQQVLVES